MAYARSAEALVALRTLKRREPSGKIQRPTTVAGRLAESQDKVMAVARSQPHRRGQSDTDSPLLGHALGRLLIERAITPDQYAAGERWKTLHEAHGRDCEGLTYRIAPQTLEGGGGRSTATDRPADQLAALRREWAAAMRALDETGEPKAAYRALTLVCTLDSYPRRDDTRGALRVGLNALHKLWR